MMDKQKRKGKSPLIVALDALLVLTAALLLLHLADTAGLAQGISGAESAEPVSGQTAQEPGSGSAAPVEYSPDTLELHVIDVGQGESLLLRCGGQTLLADAGVYDRYLKIATYLGGNGIEALDYALNTHPHADHYGALRMVMTRVPAGSFLMGKLTEALAPTDAEYLRLVDYLAESATPVEILAAGDSLALGGATVQVLSPVWEYGDLNDRSLVLRVTYGDTAFLLMGDAGTEPEEDILLKYDDLSADVLVVGHHGSNTSTGGELLAAVRPTYAAISVGADNDYGFPSDRVLERLAQSKTERILRTDLDGNIVFISDGESVAVRTEK